MKATTKRLHALYATFTVRTQIFVEPGQDVDEVIQKMADSLDVTFPGDEKVKVMEVEGQEGL